MLWKQVTRNHILLVYVDLHQICGREFPDLNVRNVSLTPIEVTVLFMLKLPEHSMAGRQTTSHLAELCHKTTSFQHMLIYVKSVAHSTWICAWDRPNYILPTTLGM